MMWLAPAWFWGIPFIGLYLVYLHKNRALGAWSFRTMPLGGAAVLMMTSLARPVLPHAPVEIERRGSDVIFAVDISRSMQADDIAPSRLAAARQLLQTTVRSDERNRFGVIAFTTNPIILSPLTRDDELLLHLFEGLDTSMVITKGTSFDGALRLARKLSKAPHPVVVLLTDGGDEAEYTKEAAWAREAGLIVDVVMLATDAGSTLRESGGGLLRDAEGGIVVTARNDAAEVLASGTGGRMIEGADAAAVSNAIADQLKETNTLKGKIVFYQELFYYPLAVALLLAMLGMTDITARLRRKHD